MDKVKEMYEVKYNRLKEDGFWEYGCYESVWVNSTIHREKDNHAEAERLFHEQHPDYQIVSISYC